jgi:hypothetical protein
MMILLSGKSVKGHESQLYYFGRILIRGKVFLTNDRTITQLKNAGGLRLIRKTEAADSIVVYQKMVEEIVTNEQFERTERNNSYQVLSQLFNPFVLDSMVTRQGINRPQGNPPLRSYDLNSIQNVAFYVHAIKGSIYQVDERLKNLKLKATNTIEFLQKAYHLD